MRSRPTGRLRGGDGSAGRGERRGRKVRGGDGELGMRGGREERSLGRRMGRPVAWIDGSSSSGSSGREDGEGEVRCSSDAGKRRKKKKEKK